MVDWSILGLIVLMFAVGYSCNRRTERVREELQELYEDIDEIREWLIEIDSRFEPEKRLLEDAFGGSAFAPLEHLEYTKKRREEGKRTIHDPLRRAWRAKQKQEG